MTASKRSPSKPEARARAGLVAAGLLRVRLRDVWHALRTACGPHARPDDVHRLRVATRRGTAALAAFRDLIPSKQRAWFRKRLARLRRTAGKARDLDLLADRLATATGPSRGRLLKTLSKWRKTSRRPLGEHLEQLVAKDWQHRVDRLLKRVRGCQSATFRAFARRRLAPLVTRFLRAASGGLREPVQLHALRIECKKLRYALEIFGPALPAAAGDRCLRSLERLQEILGVFTDHMAAAERFDRWSHRDEAGPRRADLRLLVDEEWRRAARARRSFRAWWNRSRQHMLRHRLELLLRRRFT